MAARTLILFFSPPQNCQPVYDRGTTFGLKTGGRTESILMSLPLSASWMYDFHPVPGSPEADFIDATKARWGRGGDGGRGHGPPPVRYRRVPVRERPPGEARRRLPKGSWLTHRSHRPSFPAEPPHLGLKHPADTRRKRRTPRPALERVTDPPRIMGSRAAPRQRKPGPLPGPLCAAGSPLFLPSLPCLSSSFITIPVGSAAPLTRCVRQRLE